MTTNDNDEKYDNAEPEDAGEFVWESQYRMKSRKIWLLGLYYYVPWSFVSYTMKLIVKWIIILDVNSGKAFKFSVKQVNTGQHHKISAENDSSIPDKILYGRSEFDSNVDTAVPWANFCIGQ